MENTTQKSGRSLAGYLPWHFMALGQTVTVYGEKYKAVLRTEDRWKNGACCGCDLANGKDCKSLQCSMFDRKDGKNVWFVKCMTEFER